MKKVIVSVISDLYTDQRVHRTCNALYSMGYQVVLIGRKNKSSSDLAKRNYSTDRIALTFSSGPLFYLEFNIKLFLFLWKSQADVFVANDLDTLLPNYIVSKFRKAKLVYDSHEIYTEVPELQKRPIKKFIWETLERFILPKLEYLITVNNSIANYYNLKYKKQFQVIRNISEDYVDVYKTKEYLGLPISQKLIILQGAGININRGAEELIEAMRYLENVTLLIIGSGDVIDKLKKMATKEHLKAKIIFKNKMPKEELVHYTASCDIGISIDKETNLNYRYSLPNKIFDYINAQIPIIASPLTEIKQIIDTYQIGEFIENHDPKHIASKIDSLLKNKEKLKLFKTNLLRAKSELNWQTEEQKLKQFFNSIG